MDEARGAAGSERAVLPVCMVVERELDVLAPEVPMDVRDTGGGGATRDDADGGETTRACLVDTTERPDALDVDVVAGAPATVALRPTAEAEAPFVSFAPETFAAELAGTFPFTKRCSLASYTIAEPAAEASAALLELIVRVKRAGVVEALTCEVKASPGGSFTTFHLALAARAL